MEGDVVEESCSDKGDCSLKSDSQSRIFDSEKSSQFSTSNRDVMFTDSSKKHMTSASAEIAEFYPEYLSKGEDEKKLLKRYYKPTRGNHRRRPQELFEALGVKYYRRVIILNALMWAIGEIHHSIGAYFVINTEESSFMDAKGFRYKFVNNSTDFTEKIFNSALLAKSSTGIMNEFGNLFGCFVPLIFHTSRYNKIVAYSSIFYCFVILFYVVQHTSTVKFIFFVQSIANMACRVTVLMHLMASLPSHIRPFSLLFLYGLDCVFPVIILLFVRLVPYWKAFIFVFPCFYALSGIIYGWLIPEPLLRLVAEYDGGRLNELMDKYEERKVVEPEHVICDTVFRGPPFTSALEATFHLFGLPLFILKIGIILVMTMIQLITQSTASHFQKSLSETDPFSNFFGMFMCRAIGTFLVIFLIYKYKPFKNSTKFFYFMCGRRFTICFFVISACVSNILVLLIDYTSFNLCSIHGASVPDIAWKMIGVGSALTAVVSSRVGIIVIRLILFEQVPVQQQSYVIPMIIIMSNAMKMVIRTFIAVSQLQWIWPYGEYVPGILACVLFSTSAIFLDNYSGQPITTGDIPCYYQETDPYPDNPIYNDDKEDFRGRKH